MAMHILCERVEEDRHHYYNEYRIKIRRAVDRYYYSFMDREDAFRLEENEDSYGDFYIAALPEWSHRFVGVMANGLPIWGKKFGQYKYFGNEVCFCIMPEEESQVFSKANQCDTEEYQSFIRWRRVRKHKKLAFIYLGIFWMLEEGESLNDAAKRFIQTYSDVRRIFDKRRADGKCEYFWESEIAIETEKELGNCEPLTEENIYIAEIFKDGALVFKDDTVYINSMEFDYSPSALWGIMAAEGFFAQEGVKKLSAIEYFVG